MSIVLPFTRYWPPRAAICSCWVLRVFCGVSLLVLRLRFCVVCFGVGGPQHRYAMVIPRQLRKFLYDELREFAALTLLGTPAELRGRHPLFHASELARINLSIRIPSDYI